MAEEEKAIVLFESQKAKINEFLIDNDEFWRATTLELVWPYINNLPGVNPYAVAHFERAG